MKNKGNNANTLLCADNFTGYIDDANKPIFVGDKLKSEWNYEVIVVKDEDGDTAENWFVMITTVVKIFFML